MVTTNDKELADKARNLANFGISTSYSREQSDSFSIPTFENLGYNYKLSDISAAVGIAQVKKIKTIINRKTLLAEYWDYLLENYEYITAPFIEKFNVPNWQGYTCLVDPIIDRNKLILALKKNGVQTQIGTYSSCVQPVYNEKDNSCPISIDIYERSIRLPLFVDLTVHQIDLAFDIIKNTITNLLLPKLGDI